MFPRGALVLLLLGGNFVIMLAAPIPPTLGHDSESGIDKGNGADGVARGGSVCVRGETVSGSRTGAIPAEIVNDAFTCVELSSEFELFVCEGNVGWNWEALCPARIFHALKAADVLGGPWDGCMNFFGPRSNSYVTFSLTIGILLNVVEEFVEGEIPEAEVMGTALNSSASVETGEFSLGLAADNNLEEGRAVGGEGDWDN